jgi:hypothetical protein
MPALAPLQLLVDGLIERLDPPPRLAVRAALGLRQALLRLADAVVPAQAALFEKAMGMASTGLLALAAKHRLADRLADGPRGAQDLAHQTGLAAEPLERTLRGLATLGVFERTPDGRYANNRLSLALREGAPASLRAFAEYLGTRSNLHAWADFEETVRTGRSAFERVHGASVWDWFDAHPAERELFAQTMTQLAGLFAAGVAGAYPWHEVRRVCDVGGGRGHLLAEILRRHAHLQGMLLDGAGVIELARVHLAAQGLAPRVALHAGSFFEAVPPGADAYLLKDVLHDWDDARCLQVLRNVRAAAAPGARALVAELVVEPDTVSGPGPFVDLHMMTISGEGKQRSRAELAALFASSGFRLERVIATPVLVDVVEGVAI